MPSQVIVLLKTDTDVGGEQKNTSASKDLPGEFFSGVGYNLQLKRHLTLWTHFGCFGVTATRVPWLFMDGKLTCMEFVVKSKLNSKYQVSKLFSTITLKFYIPRNQTSSTPFRSIVLTTICDTATSFPSKFDWCVCVWWSVFVYVFKKLYSMKSQRICF